MGKGIDMARAAGAGIHADVLDDMKDQLLIVLIKRLADAKGVLVLPVAEIDDTGRDILSFSVDPVTRAFTFQLKKKS
jgi:hypothetical protein